LKENTVNPSTLIKTLNRTALGLLLACAASPVLAQSAPQQIIVPISRPGEPVNLKISIISAYIEVIGEDREDAAFEVSAVDGQRKIVTPSGTQSLQTAGYAIEVEENDNNLSLDADWRANKVRPKAQAPSASRATCT
jgi:hypothetical protein